MKKMNQRKKLLNAASSVPQELRPVCVLVLVMKAIVTLRIRLFKHARIQRFTLPIWVFQSINNWIQKQLTNALLSNAKVVFPVKSEEVLHESLKGQVFAIENQRPVQDLPRAWQLLGQPRRKTVKFDV